MRVRAEPTPATRERYEAKPDRCWLEEVTPQLHADCAGEDGGAPQLLQDHCVVFIPHVIKWSSQGLRHHLPVTLQVVSVFDSLNTLIPSRSACIACNRSVSLGPAATFPLDSDSRVSH